MTQSKQKSGGYWDIDGPHQTVMGSDYYVVSTTIEKPHTTVEKTILVYSPPTEETWYAKGGKGYGRRFGHDSVPTFGKGTKQEAINAAIEELEKVEREFSTF